MIRWVTADLPGWVNRTRVDTQSQRCKSRLHRLARHPNFFALNQIGRETVTQQMVAAAARVHVSTVSLALRDDPRLPESTRRRVRSAARPTRLCESNPLISASHVAGAPTRRRRLPGHPGLALHTAPQGTPRLSDHVHRNFLRGASERAGELGYKVEEFFLSQLPRQAKRFASELRERNITGLVVEHTPAPSCPGRRLPFDLAPFASSSLGVPLAHPQLHYVANDQYMRPILAARELLGLGLPWAFGAGARS